MIKGTTTSGFDYEIAEEVADNWELVEILGKVQRGDYTLIDRFPAMILGEEQAIKFMDHVVKIKGYKSTNMITGELKEIMDESRELKN